MNKIKVAEAPLVIHSGQVRLRAEQARTRAAALRLVGAVDKAGTGVYEVVAPVQFKVGELLEFSGELGKTGAVRDPDAEALARLEAEDRVRAAVRAEFAAKLAAQRDEFERTVADINAAHRKTLDDLEARHAAELAAARAKA